MKKTVRDIDVCDKRVLVRVDFNVPLAPDGSVASDARIRASLPTIQYLRERGARVVLMSHLGMPDGRVVERMRLRPVARALGQLLSAPVAAASECVGPEVERLAGSLGSGDVLLLENLRFHPEEEANDSAFAGQLARLGDIYVNDAFGTAHRAHASTVGVTAFLPSVAGLLMERDMSALSQLLGTPRRPLVALIGGAKVSTKLGVLANLLTRVDSLLIGGGMAATFLKAKGLEVGRSLVEPDFVPTALVLLSDAEKRGVFIGLPVDVVVAERAEAGDRTAVVDAGAVPGDMMIVDIGPRTVSEFSRVLAKAGTVFWNGPVGVFEVDEFAAGTRAIAATLAGLRAVTVVGGGDSVAAVEGMRLADRFTHVSTGGGASLEFLEGKVLPGVAALEDIEP